MMACGGSSSMSHQTTKECMRSMRDYCGAGRGRLEGRRQRVPMRRMGLSSRPRSCHTNRPLGGLYDVATTVPSCAGALATHLSR